MRIIPPEELRGYVRDYKPGEWIMAVRRTFSFLFPVSLLVLISALIWWREETSLVVGSLSAVFILGLMVALLDQKKFELRCVRCRSVTQIIDTLIVPEQLSRMERMFYETGADGSLYVFHEIVDREMPGHPVVGGSIDRLWHRWHVCHQCRRYFFGTKVYFERIIDCRDKEEFIRAMELIRSDPKAMTILHPDTKE